MSQDLNNTADSSFLTDDGSYLASDVHAQPPQTIASVASSMNTFAADLQFDLDSRRKSPRVTDTTQRPGAATSATSPPNVAVSGAQAARSTAAAAASIDPRILDSFEARTELPVPSSGGAPQGRSSRAGSFSGSVNSEVGLPDPTPVKAVGAGGDGGSAATAPAASSSGQTLTQALNRAHSASSLNPDHFSDDEGGAPTRGRRDSRHSAGRNNSDHDETFFDDSDDDVDIGGMLEGRSSNQHTAESSIAPPPPGQPRKPVTWGNMAGGDVSVSEQSDSEAE